MSSFAFHQIPIEFRQFFVLDIHYFFALRLTFIYNFRTQI
jgi:hypothetical protein